MKKTCVKERAAKKKRKRKKKKGKEGKGFYLPSSVRKLRTGASSEQTVCSKWKIAV